VVVVASLRLSMHVTLVIGVVLVALLRAAGV
jgi:uncharacterized membrane protein